MKLVIGKETIDVEILPHGTYKPEQSEKRLREIKVKFTIRGVDALERYKALDSQASRKGVISEELPEIPKTLWKHSVADSPCYQTSDLEPGQNWYEATWILSEHEDHN